MPSIAGLPPRIRYLPIAEASFTPGCLLAVLSRAWERDIARQLRASAQASALPSPLVADPSPSATAPRMRSWGPPRSFNIHRRRLTPLSPGPPFGTDQLALAMFQRLYERDRS